MTIRPHCRYRPRKRGFIARITTAVANGWVTFHPDKQPERVMQQSEGDFRTWAAIVGVTRGVVLRDVG